MLYFRSKTGATPDTKDMKAIVKTFENLYKK
jgi:hypothetical protein